MTSPIQEKVAVFGEGRGLVGILALPAGGQPPRAPCAILLSTGVLHRAGSNRLWVTLARALGTAGFASLRFDLSGIGDSERRRDVQSIRESMELDVAEAISYLNSTIGADRFVLIGLCSGAHDAFHAMLSESRVVGAAMVDMPGPFQTWRHTAHHLLARMLQPASWRDPFTKVVFYAKEFLRSGRPQVQQDDTDVVGERNADTRERMRSELSTLLDRGVRLYFSFTPGLEENYNHRGQFRHAFPEAAGHAALSYDYFPEADHVFSSAASRAQLVEAVVRWTQGQVAEIR